MFGKFWEIVEGFLGTPKYNAVSIPGAEKSSTKMGDADDTSRVRQGNIELTLFGLPSNVNMEERQRIVIEVLQHFAKTHKREENYQVGQIAQRSAFFVEFNGERKKVEYELRILKFLTALQIYREALDWVEMHQVQGKLDSEVANITEKHLRSLAQKELDEIRRVQPKQNINSISTNNSSTPSESVDDQSNPIQEHQDGNPDQ